MLFSPHQRKETAYRKKELLLTTVIEKGGKLMKNVMNGLKKKVLALVLAVSMVTAVAVPVMANPTQVMADEKSFEDQVKDAKKKIYEDMNAAMKDAERFNDLASIGTGQLKEAIDKSDMSDKTKETLKALAEDVNPFGIINETNEAVAKYAVITGMYTKAEGVKDNKVLAEAYKEVITEVSEETHEETLAKAAGVFVDEFIPGGCVIKTVWDFIVSLFD